VSLCPPQIPQSLTWIRTLGGHEWKPELWHGVAPRSTLLQYLAFPTFIEEACQGAAEDEDTSSLRNVGNLGQDCTASQLRGQQFLAVNIFVNAISFISTVVHSCVSSVMLLNDVLVIFILRISSSFWWQYMNNHQPTNQSLLRNSKANVCMLVVASTVLTTAVPPQGPVHSLWLLPARFHPSLCGELIWVLHKNLMMQGIQFKVTFTHTKYLQRPRIKRPKHWN
jgi:hypothetical protein